MKHLNLQTVDSARLMRNGAVDAMAALNFALAEAIVGLSPEQAKELKRATGEAMGSLIEHIINPAIRAYPELELNQTNWSAVVRAQVLARARCYEQATAATSPDAPTEPS